jgi:hypothetical protein
MIRVRNVDGSAQVIQPGKTVEICSVDGLVARILLWDGTQVVSLGPEDRGFGEYCRVMKAQPAEVVAMKEA